MSIRLNASPTGRGKNRSPPKKNLAYKRLAAANKAKEETPIYSNAATGEIYTPVASTAPPNASFERNFDSVYYPVATSATQAAPNSGVLYSKQQVFKRVASTPVTNEKQPENNVQRPEPPSQDNSSSRVVLYNSTVDRVNAGIRQNPITAAARLENAKRQAASEDITVLHAGAVQFTSRKVYGVPSGAVRVPYLFGVNPLRAEKRYATIEPVSDVPQIILGTYNAFRHPIESAKGTVRAVFNPVAREQALKQIGDRPLVAVGEFYLPGKVLSETVAFGKNAYVKVGSDYVPPEKIFSAQVLEEGKPVPTVSSIQESLELFNKRTPEGDIKVSTASPQAMKGKTIGLGRKGGLPTPIEDPGVYTTPSGQASPGFLGINNGNPGYTLNPIETFSFGVPTVTEFTVKSVEMQPRSVVSKPGFGEVKVFLESQAGSGKAFITKRSEVGQGNLPKQSFVASSDFEIPFKGKPKQVRKGDVLIEGGTSELEAVVPPGTNFEYTTKSLLGKVKGFDKYTMFNGRAVAIRDADIIPGSVKPLSSEKTVFSFDKVSKESSSLSSDMSERPSLITLSAPAPVYSEPAISTKPLEVSKSNVSSRSSRLQEAAAFSITSTPNASRTSVLSVRSSTPKITSSDSLFDTPGRSSPVSNSSNSGSSQNVISYPRIARTPSASFFPIAPRSSQLIQVSKPSNFSDSLRDVAGFRVSVRKAGKFGLVSRDVFNYDDALKFGRERVAGTSAASFKLVPTEDKVNRLFRGGIAGKESDFSLSKRERGVFVEKNAKRINTVGELREITFKGQETLKSRKLL